MQIDEDILDYWFEKRNLSTSTRDIYSRAIQQYTEFLTNTIKEEFF
jgi:uncharacterized protein YfaS (alpha-2-macroglobulin family)